MCRKERQGSTEELCDLAMTIKVYGFPLSQASNRVVPVLYELGVDFELVHVNPLTGQAKSPQNLKRQVNDIYISVGKLLQVY